MPAGTAPPGSSSPTASFRFICRPTARNCNLPNISGRSSTSPSQTNILKRSMLLMPLSPSVAPRCSVKSSRQPPPSTGGQNRSLRINQPDLVSLGLDAESKNQHGTRQEQQHQYDLAECPFVDTAIKP